MDFRGFPRRAYFFAKASKHKLVDTVGIGIIIVRLILMWARRPHSLRIAGTVEPVEVCPFVWDPLLDRTARVALTEVNGNS
jgi:hypothetical protein